MYYDDQARRFTVLSGLAFGVALGAGVALLLPRSSARSRSAAPRDVGSWTQLVAERSAARGSRAGESLAEAARLGAERFGR